MFVSMINEKNYFSKELPSKPFHTKISRQLSDMSLFVYHIFNFIVDLKELKLT